jgi:hypothetical protein
MGGAVSVCPVAAQGVQQRDELGMGLVVEPAELGLPGRSCRRLVDGVERVHASPSLDLGLPSRSWRRLAM